MRNFFESVGAAVINWSRQAIGLLALFFDVVSRLLWPFGKKRTERQNVFEQMLFAGVNSLPMVVFVALFAGVVIAMQAAPRLESLGAVLYVGGVVAVSVARETAPVLTGLIIAGRVGAAMSAELGAIKAAGKLETTGDAKQDIVEFFVVPRFLALIATFPCLTIIADAVGLFGGCLVAAFNLNLDMGLCLDTAFRFLTAEDIITGIAKSFVFAAIIALAGCYYGLNASGGKNAAEAVGKAASRSITVSFALILLADCAFTAVFFFAGI